MFYIFFIYLFYIFIKSTRKKGSSLIDPKAAFLNAFFAFLAYIGREKMGFRLMSFSAFYRKRFIINVLKNKIICSINGFMI